MMISIYSRNNLDVVILNHINNFYIDVVQNKADIYESISTELDEIYQPLQISQLDFLFLPSLQADNKVFLSQNILSALMATDLSQG